MSAYKTFSHALQLRFADIDRYGHVNHATYFTFLETARLYIIREAMPELLHGPVQFIISDVKCSYLKPILIDSPVIVTTNVKEVTRATFTLSYDIHDGNGLVYAKAETALVSFSPEKGRPVAVPEAFVKGVTL